MTAIAWLRERKSEGFKLMLWSMRGENHARAIASQMGCYELFDVITSKPGFIVDDEGWRWIKRTQVVRVNRVKGGSNLYSPSKESIEKHRTQVTASSPQILKASNMPPCVQ